MINKRKMALVGFAVIIVWFLSYIIHLIELKPSLDITKIHYGEVSLIKIYDRGILGNDSVLISDGEKLKLLSKLIVSSSKVKYKDINIKSNQGLCEVELRLKTMKSINLVITKTSSSGGILNSGDYYYRNDSLLKVIVRYLKPSTSRSHNPAAASL